MITDIILRVSGVVAYKDNTSSPFNATYEDGIVINPISAASLAAFQQLKAGKGTLVQALLNSLRGTHTFSTAAPSPSKTVTGWTMHFTGRITRNNNTSGDFAVVYDAKGGSRVIAGASVYAEVLANATYKSKVLSALNALAGSGKAAIAA